MLNYIIYNNQLFRLKFYFLNKHEKYFLKYIQSNYELIYIYQ